MKKRTYIAIWDDGHDFGEFVFDSIYRANSKANKEDAKTEARRKYGRISKNWNIVETYLYTSFF